MFDQLVDVVSHASAWAYAALVVVAAFDALFPVVPSETAVITAGVLAAAGELSLAAVVACAAVGAALGDNAAYALGRRVARTGFRLVSADRLAWAERRLAVRSAELIVVARFIPGGRTAVTLTAGAVRFPWRRFVALDAAAAAVWGGYAASLGFFGGEVFAHRPWHGLALALGIAFCLTVVVESLRRLHRRAPRR